MSFVPERGDIIWLQFIPSAGREHAGREQRGHRPALVLSPASYNKKTSLAIVCPMTSKSKGYPFEVEIEPDSIVLADQIRSLDWRARKASPKSKCSKKQLNDVMTLIEAILYESAT